MPSQRARILVELARDAVDSGANERANAYFAELFRDDAAGDVGLYARALLERAKAGLARGTLDLAQRDVNEALSLFRAQQLLSSVFSGLVLQARIGCARADAPSARTSIDSALDVAEQLRRSSNNPTLRASLWQPLRPAFDFKIRHDQRSPDVWRRAPGRRCAGRPRGLRAIAQSCAGRFSPPRHVAGRFIRTVGRGTQARRALRATGRAPAADRIDLGIRRGRRSAAQGPARRSVQPDSRAGHPGRRHWLAASRPRRHARRGSPRN